MNFHPAVSVAMLLAAMASAHPRHAMAEDFWKGFQPTDRLGALVGTTGCAVSAVAQPPEVGQRASVYLWGGKGSGRFSIGVVIDDLDAWLPATALDPFRGPDVSPRFFQDEPVRITLRSGSDEVQVMGRLLLVSTGTLPETVRRKAEESLAMSFMDPEGRYLDRKATKLLAAMSRGFDSGEIRIAIGVGTMPLHVRFPGSGAQPCARTLAEFIRDG